jgi:hypothetical protein
VTREALLFLSQVSAININADGISSGSRPLKLSIKLPASTEDVDEMRRMAGMLGRWFAYQPATASILQTMGIRV